MKKQRLIILVVALLFIVACFTACDQSDELAAVKVSFCDSMDDNEPLFPGSYDLRELSSTGLNAYVPVKEGYDFTGWTIDKDGTTAFDPATHQGIEALLTVYAQWSERKKIITYNGANQLKTYYYDDLVTGKTTIDEAVKKGYNFLGWTTDSEKTTSFDLKSFVYPSDTKSVKIFANYEIITTLSFYNGKDLMAQLILSDLKETKKLPTPTKEGYNFVGWCTDEACTKNFDLANFVGVSSTANIYAKFEAKPIVYYYNGETLIQQYYLENAETVTVQTPTKEGYTFTGWKDSAGDKFVVNPEAQNNQTAYASWEQKVTVHFVKGEDSISTAYLENLNDNNMPTVSKETYTFIGWYLDKDFDKEFVLESYQPSAKEITLYAKLEKITTVSFMNDNMQVGEPILLSALKAGTADAPTVSKEGFSFYQWTLDKEGTKPFVVDYIITHSDVLCVYAQWSEKIKVNYYIDKDLYESKILDEIDKTYVPNEPTKEDYIFLGWIDDDKQTFNLNVDSEETLNAYAKWRKYPVVEGLTYQLNGSTITVTWIYEEDISYSVKVDNGEFTSVKRNEFVVPTELSVGKHTIFVKGTFRQYDSDENSVEITQKINFALTGVFFDKSTRVIHWDQVANAEYYMVKFNNDDWKRIDNNSFTVSSDVKKGGYSLTVKAYAVVDDMIIDSFAPQTNMVNVVSVERLTESGLFINENDEYVLLSEGTYSFNNYVFRVADWYTLSEGNKKITVKTGYNGTSQTLTTTDDKKIAVIIHNAINTISGGSNWTYYKSKANASAINNEETNKTGFMNVSQMYEVGTQDNAYILDLNIDGTGSVVTDYILDITGRVGNDTDIDTYVSLINGNDNYYKLSWTDKARSLDNGTVVILTVKAHYPSKVQMESAVPSFTFTFKINNGVNAYGFADLKEKFGDLDYDTINMHQNIFVTQADVGEDFGKDKTTNNPASSWFTRTTSDYEEFRLNGNYFKVDGSAVRRGVSDEHDAGTDYKVYWVRVYMFNIENKNETVEEIKNGETTYFTKKMPKAEFSNLELKGNATIGMSTTITSQGDEAIKKELLAQSGAIDGINASNYAETYKNCSIHHTTEPIKVACINGSDDNNKVVLYRDYNVHIIDECAFGDNWANNSYLWTDGKVIYRNSHIYNASGVAVILGDCKSSTLGKALNGGNAIEYANNELCLSNFPTIVFDNTEFDNWALGSEEYYTAYAMSNMIAQNKATMENIVSSTTNDAYTLIKKDDPNAESSPSRINMIFQANPDGDMHGYDITYVGNDGKSYTSNIRAKKIGDSYVPNHPMATENGTPKYTKLFPICAYSNSKEFYKTNNGDMSKIFTSAFTDAQNIASENGGILVEVTMPNMSGKMAQGISTIIIEAMPVSQQ